MRRYHSNSECSKGRQLVYNPSTRRYTEAVDPSIEGPFIRCLSDQRRISTKAFEEVPLPLEPALALRGKALNSLEDRLRIEVRFGDDIGLSPAS